MSGNDFNEEQFENIPLILVTLLIIYLDILGKDNNEEQLENIQLILITLFVSI